MDHRKGKLTAKNDFLRVGWWLLFAVLLVDTAFAGNDMAAMKRAELLLNKGWYLEALSRLQEVVEHTNEPNTKASALLLIGQTYGSYLDQNDIAQVYYENIMATYPKSTVAADALFGCGLIYFNKGDYEKAYAVFTQYMRENPKSIRYKSAAAWADIAQPLITPTVCAETSVRPTPRPDARPTQRKTSMEPILRVLTHKDSKKITIYSTQPILVELEDGRKRIYSGWGPVGFSLRSNRLFLNGRAFPCSTYRVTSAASELELNGRSYRGSFTISVASGGLMAVNHISAEQYLYGVIPGEMPSAWPMDALMAQAVAARTYALYMKEKSIEKSYDLEANTVSQVYGGLLTETSRTNLAVDNTRGQVMTHDGRLIAAYYHSNSGGHTEDPCNVWNASIPYLRGIPDRFSTGSACDDWEYFLTYEDATRRLKACGYRIGHVEQLRVEGTSRSGRTLRILVVSDKGVTPFSSSHFRMTIGENHLKSTLFHILPSAKGILFKGRGYGHGVGMSQWGAKRMARLGSSYRDILTHYYHGVQIVSMNS